MQLSTCEVFFDLVILAMTTKIQQIMKQLFSIVLAKFYFSRLKGFYFRRAFYQILSKCLDGLQ